MKLFLVFVLSLITTTAISQQNALQKLWVTNNNEYMLADSAVIRFEAFYKDLGNTRIAKYYRLIEDTLRLREYDIETKATYSDFLIDTLQRDKLILTPVGTNATLLTNYITGTGTKKQLIYQPAANVQGDPMQFEKIVFSSTNCYGFCPDMVFEINKDQEVKFIGRKWAVKQGTFYATFPDSLLHELVAILNRSALDKIKGNKDRNIDAPTYTIEVHYNNKVKLLSSCSLPFVTDDLLKFLMAIPSKINLLATKDNIDIRFSNQ